MQTLARIPPIPSPPSLASKRLVCDRCWELFNDPGAAVCPDCGRQRPEEGWPALPLAFRHFVFLDRLGRGGMGAVFRACYGRISRGESDPSQLVAVKVVRKRGHPKEEQLYVAMFKREQGATALLSSDRNPDDNADLPFVRVLETSTVDPPFMALEYVPWHRLVHLLSEAPLPPKAVARIGVALLKAVEDMHRYRIVHRDLTPANVFVRQPEDLARGLDVKIGDFGLWVQAAASEEAVTHAPVNMAPRAGPQEYSSPEQLRGVPVDERSDLYSCGTVLWELATGRLPHPLEDPDGDDGLARRLEAMRADPTPAPELDGDLDVILRKALRHDRKKRWASAREMRKALESLQALPSRESLGSLAEALERSVALGVRLGEMADGLIEIKTLHDLADGLQRRVQALLDPSKNLSPDALEAEIEVMHSEIESLEARAKPVLEWPRDGGERRPGAVSAVEAAPSPPSQEHHTTGEASPASAGRPAWSLPVFLAVAAFAFGLGFAAASAMVPVAPDPEAGEAPASTEALTDRSAEKRRPVAAPGDGGAQQAAADTVSSGRASRPKAEPAEAGPPARAGHEGSDSPATAGQKQGPTPEAKPGSPPEPPLRDSPPREEIVERLNAVAPAVRRCLPAAAAARTSSLTVRFVIEGESGRVVEPEVESPPFRERRAMECVQAALAGMRFAPSRKRRVNVRAPLDLRGN